MKKWLILPMSLFFLFGCSDSGQNGQNGSPAPGETEEQTDSLAEIAENLDIPWAINKHGDEFYISERTGSVAFIEMDGAVIRQEVEFSSPLSSAAEAGFLGFVLKQDFDDSNEAYAYYVYEEDGNSYNRIAVITLENDSWSEGEILLDAIPTGDVHHGGRLALDEDGVLFATIGDASQPELAQDPESVNGKILRLGDDGEFEIFSTGHRNPQGLAWSDGQMYASEHGESANDEINIVEEGNNYGWPVIEGNQEESGLETPFITSGQEDTWAPSGIAISGNSLYVAALRGTAIKVFDLESGEELDSIEDFGRIRDVLVDGSDLYFITNNTDGRGFSSGDDDKLYRMAIGE